jgi:hypothetical protein
MMTDLDGGGTPACPECYMVWAKGVEGDYRLARKISRWKPRAYRLNSSR